MDFQFLPPRRHYTAEYLEHSGYSAFIARKRDLQGGEGEPGFTDRGEYDFTCHLLTFFCYPRYLGNNDNLVFFSLPIMEQVARILASFHWEDPSL